MLVPKMPEIVVGGRELRRPKSRYDFLDELGGLDTSGRHLTDS